MKRSLNVFLPFVCLLLFALPVVAQQKTWDELMKEGNLASDQKRFAEAESFFRDALRTLETQKPNEEQPKLRISTLTQLAKVLDRQQKTDDAELVATSAVELLETVLKKSPPKAQEARHYAYLVTVKVYSDMADLFADHKKFTTAEELYKKVIAVQLKRKSETTSSRAPRNNADFLTWMVGSISGDNGELAKSYFQLGNLYFDDRKLPEAERSFMEAVKLTSEKDSKTGEFRGNPFYLMNLGVACAAQGKYPQAESNLLKSIVLMQKGGNLASDTATSAIQNYVLALKKQGRAAEAETFLNKLQAGEAIEPPK